MQDISAIRKEGSSCTELIECFFGLSKSECFAFYLMAAKESVTLDELSNKIGRDRSTTHRLLQKLVNLGLCYKEKITIPRGGYVHKYSSVSISRLKEDLEGRINTYVKDIENLLSCLDGDLEKKIGQFKDKELAQS